MRSNLRRAVLISAVSLALCFVTACMSKEGGAKMKLSSPAFEHNDYMPKKYTCQGENISPPLVVEDIPEDTKTLALIVDDPDAPAKTWIHWVVYNIKPLAEVEDNTVPGTQGKNDSNPRNYGGPCPPSGTHRYFFKLYALDTELDLAEGATKEELLEAMEGHIIEKAELIGLYEKK